MSVWPNWSCWWPVRSIVYNLQVVSWVKRNPLYKVTSHMAQWTCVLYVLDSLEIGHDSLKPLPQFSEWGCLSRVRDNPHGCHQWHVRESCSVVASAGTKLPIPTAYNSTSKNNKHLHNISTPEVQQTLENFAKCNPNPSTPFIRGALKHWHICQKSPNLSAANLLNLLLRDLRRCHVWLLFMKL